MIDSNIIYSKYFSPFQIRAGTYRKAANMGIVIAKLPLSVNHGVNEIMDAGSGVKSRQVQILALVSPAKWEIMVDPTIDGAKTVYWRTFSRGARSNSRGNQ